jgi:proton glutamate symport protein
MKFWIKMISGLFIGIIVGSYIGPDSLFVEPLRTVGTLFFRVMGFLVLPLLLLSGIRSIIFLRRNRRLFLVAVRAMGYFILLTAVGATIGMVLGSLLQPGVGTNIVEFESPNLIHYPKTSEYILNIAPESILEFLTSGYGVLAIIFVAFLLGTGILLAQEEAEGFHGLIVSIDETLHRLNRIVLEFLPIGIFTYMGYFMGFMTSSTVVPYLKLLLVIVAGAFVQVFVVQALTVYFLTKLNPFKFIHAVLPAMIMGYVSGNRYSAYPPLVECMEHNLGADREMFTLVSGLGTGFSHAGSAIAAAVSTLFVAQSYGLDISIYLKIIIVFLITVSSLKLDGLLDGGLVLLSVVLAQIIKLPAEGYAIILSITVIMVQIETLVNVMGNATVSYVLSHAEGAVKAVNVRDFL